MTDWKADELDAIARGSELEIAPLRPDGALREPVTIWVVHVGDDLFVRSVRGAAGSGYQGSRSVTRAGSRPAPSRCRVRGSRPQPR
jgi:hypothetical protein